MLPKEHPVGAVLLSIVALFLHGEGYRLGVLGAAVWFGLGILYFALWGRRHLVYAPEEEFAAKALER